jgi:hypothetical protein
LKPWEMKNELKGIHMPPLPAKPKDEKDEKE